MIAMLQKVGKTCKKNVNKKKKQNKTVTAENSATNKMYSIIELFGKTKKKLGREI